MSGANGCDDMRSTTVEGSSAADGSKQQSDSSREREDSARGGGQSERNGEGGDVQEVAHER